MICVIKKSLFTHQKPSHCEAKLAWQNVFTCQEINNFSYVFLGHLHGFLIVLLRRHEVAGLCEDRTDQGNIQKRQKRSHMRDSWWMPSLGPWRMHPSIRSGSWPFSITYMQRVDQSCPYQRDLFSPSHEQQGHKKCIKPESQYLCYENKRQNYPLFVRSLQLTSGTWVCICTHPYFFGFWDPKIW